MKDLIERLNKFAETTTGKIVLIVLFIVLIGIIFFSIKGILFPSAPVAENQQPAQSQQANQAPQQSANQINTTTESASNQPALTSEFSLETGFEVFSGDILRDPFTPLPQEESNQTTQTTSTAETQAEKPITLLGVTYEEGVIKAVIGYEGNVVTAAPGDTVGNYMIVSVSENSARLLYGDQPIYLEVGQSFNP